MTINMWVVLVVNEAMRNSRAAALICAEEITPTFSASGDLLGVGWRRV